MSNQDKDIAPTPTRRETKKQRQLAIARATHDDWVEDNGHGGDVVSDLSYRAHVMLLARILGEDEGMVIEVTQIRRQAGLQPLDVAKLLLSGELRRATIKSRDEVVDATIENEEEAKKKALKKRQRSGRERN